jgi:crotonobetainyl-CoA:carnitine CoA-transferase CaiB-like acyl-CoA transferase
VYSLLADIRVIDLSLLAPSMVGMHLADLGATVVKIEPPRGDHTRQVGGPFRSGPSLNHLRWNRGKRSVALNLKVESGRNTYLELARVADVIIDGLRAGATDRLGIGYSAVLAVNPDVVYCSVSGLGHSGPYKRLASHGVAYDAFAGLVPVDHREDGTPYIGPHVPIGTRVAPIFAALAIASALVKRERVGMPSRLDVAEIDASALLQSDDIMRLTNVGAKRNSTPFRDAVRYQFYETADNKFVIFQPYEQKFWETFCHAIDRTDLLSASGLSDPNALDTAAGNEPLRRQLAAIFMSRTQRQWIEFFIEFNVPGGPVYSLEEMLSDPHFVSRANLVEQVHPEVGRIQMTTTPIKVQGEEFSVTHAPKVGEQSEAVLQEWLGISEGALDRLRRDGAIA